jgi:putative nucleotidyltransferase with HDIG domain
MAKDLKKIIFVDDEPNVLQGLRRTLRPMRASWDMQFFEHAEDALEAMEENGAVDIVVSDMRMPGMSGVDFLSEVMRRYPETVRFALSGQVQGEMLVRAYAVTHQFLNKPFGAGELQQQVSRAFALRDHLANQELNKKLLALGGVPAMPHAYQTIRREMLSDEPDLDRIAEAIESDPGLSAKVLQIINSSFLGLRHHISSIKQACTLLGLGNLQNIVLLSGVLNLGEGKHLPKGFALESLWTHSLRVAHYAQALARQEAETKAEHDDAYTAGLLHDIGKVMLAVELPEEFQKALHHAEEKNMLLLDAEREVFGSTHAEISAYLLELWGLPSTVCRAIAFHDYPSACPEDICDPTAEEGFSPLTALHIANWVAGQASGKQTECLVPEVDMVYLERIGAADKVMGWYDVCAAAEPAD